jgi:hypothetical protein
VTYLSISSNVYLSNTADVSSAPNKTQQSLDVNPPLNVQIGRMYEASLAVDETVSIMDTRRTLNYDATSEFVISMPRGDETTTFRLAWSGVGTHPGFRTGRSIGLDATSEVRIQVLSTLMARIDTSAGTALSTGSVAIGDTLLIERSTDTYTSPFALANQGIPVIVQGKGTGYVDVVHNNAFVDEEVLLGADYSNAIRIFSQAPVAIGDVVELGGSFNFGNRGIFPIVQVRDDYIEYSVESGVAESVATVSTGDLICYDKYVNFISLKASGSAIMYVDDNPVTIHPIDASGALLMLSLRATKLEVTNNDTSSVTILASFSTIASGC